MKIIFTQKFSLQLKRLNDCLAELRAALKKESLDSKDSIRLVFAAEEFFLKNIESENENSNASVAVVKHWGKIKLKATCNGNALSDEDEQVDFNILSLMNLAPEYFRNGNCNGMNFSLSARKISPVAIELSVFALALLLGLIGHSLLSPKSIATISGFIRPCCEKYTAVLLAAALPMIFFMIINSIASVGSGEMIRTKLQTIFKISMFHNLSAIVGGLLVGVMFFRVAGTTQRTDGNGIGKILSDSFWNLFPHDFLSPFLSGNTAQIMVLAIALGTVMSLCKEKLSYLNKIFDELGILSQKLLSWVCLPLPLYIFLYTFYFIIGQTSWNFLQNSIAVVLWFVAASIFCGISVLLYLKLKSGESPFHFLKIVKDSLLTAFATASSMAAYQKALDEFKNKTACDSKSVGVTFPVSLVFCKPASAAYRGLLIYFAAYISGINIGVEMWPILILISFVTTISIPPVVGGSITILPLTLTPFGIPLDCIPLLVIIDAITDNFVTAANFLAAQVLTRVESASLPDKKNQ